MSRLCVLFWLTALCLLNASTATESTSRVRKCCPHDQLMTSFDKCQPLDASRDGVDAARDAWWWIHDVNKTGLELDDADVAFDVRPKCARTARTMILHENFRLVRDNDTVSLEAMVESSLQLTDDELEVWHRFPVESFCLDAKPLKNGGVVHMAVLCPCSSELACVRKCCVLGKELDLTSMRCKPVNRANYFDWAPTFQAQEEEEHRFYYLAGTNPSCAEDEAQTSSIVNSNDSQEVVFLRDGGIKVPESEVTHEKDKFCGDYTDLGHQVLVHCMRAMTKREIWMSTAYGILFVAGSVALLLLVGVSLIVPDMRKHVHGRMALMHNVMLMIAYVTAGSLHFVGVYGDGMATNSCKVLSLVMQFSFLASFFWLNVMCIDIFWVFSGLRPIQGSMMQRDRKKFAYYSIYAWGSTSVISIATISVELGSKDAYFRPAFGEGDQYFFNNKAAILLFFYGPMAALLVANFGLFVYTAIKIFHAKQATAILNSADSFTSNKNKQRLALYVKLFALMGVTWVFEVISWAVGGAPEVWFFFDVINLLRAEFVFVIFCCKRTVFEKVRRRLGCAGARDAGASIYSADTRTTSSNISRSRNATPLPLRKISHETNVTAL